MTRTRGTRQAPPSEGREVVISLDRRLLYAVGLLAAFGLAVAGGYLVTTRNTSGGEPAAAVPTPFGPGIQIDEASARATSAAQGVVLPPGAVIVTPNIAQPVVATVPPAALDQAAAKARVTPVSELHEELLKDPNAQVIEISQDPTTQAVLAERYKNAEVLANVVDPNVSDPNYAPLRLETVSQTQRGPRLAISDLNLTNTYNLGVVPMDQRVAHTFTAKNVGDQELIIQRVYTGCGCTATTIGETVIPADGILAQPVRLQPGESIAITVEYDAKAEGRAGATAKYVQIFSNDPTGTRFVDDDPMSHETRFRLVVEPTW